MYLVRLVKKRIKELDGLIPGHIRYIQILEKDILTGAGPLRHPEKALKNYKEALSELDAERDELRTFLEE
jgi:hypothetical protein